MGEKEKRASAISAAIMAYIKIEEETRSKMMAQPRVCLASLWGISARQDTMQLRRLYQLRLPKK